MTIAVVDAAPSEPGWLDPSIQIEQSLPQPTGPRLQGWATNYGRSYNGRPLGCSGFGNYSADGDWIAAVGPDRYDSWPCGTTLRLSGPAGTALVVRADACPGCMANVIDLSEAANELVCGPPAHTCQVVIQEVDAFWQAMALGWT